MQTCLLYRYNIKIKTTKTIIGQGHKLIQIRYVHNNDDAIHVGSRRKAVEKWLQTTDSIS